jgi:predicted aspartyl protease
MGIISKTIKLAGSRGEYQTTALFDTGASYSFIRRNVAEGLETITPLPLPMSFEMAEEGRQVTATERVTVDFWINGCRLSDEFLVLGALADEVIIGAKTVQAWRMKLDMEQEEVVVDPSVARLRFV